MSASTPGVFSVQQFTDLGGPLVGGRLYTYTYGTTSQKTAYTDLNGAIAHTYTSDGAGGQYIALNARGELPAPLYLVSGSYDLALKRADGSTVWTRRADPVSDAFVAQTGAGLVGFLYSIGYPAGTVGDWLRGFGDATDPAKGDARIAIKSTLAGSIATTLHGWVEASEIDVGRVFGVVADGSTDQTAKMLAAVAAATLLKPCTLVLPRGTTYCATSIGNLAIQGLSIRGRGLLESTLKFGHVGVAMLVDAFAQGLTSDDATAPFVQVNLQDFTIQGNANTTHLLQMQGVSRGRVNVNLKDANTATGIGLHAKGVMEMEQLNFVCSTDFNAMTFAPSEAARIEAGTRVSVSVGNSSNNKIHARISGVGVGLRLSGADNNVVTGASESCATYGVLVATGCRHNTLMNFGMESPSAASADCSDSGEFTKYLRCYSSKSILLQGRGADIDGGYYERIELQSGALKNRVRDVRVNHWRTGSGGYFDSGTATEWSNIFGTACTATFATNVMTVTAVGFGVLAVGQVVNATGVVSGTTISSLGTGTGGTGTYNLSTSPGTLSSRAVQTEGYVYPLKSRTAITITASPFRWINTTGQYVEVFVVGGTVTAILGYRDTDFWIRPATSPTSHLVAPGDQLDVSYSVVPTTMSYVPHNGFQG